MPAIGLSKMRVQLISRQNFNTNDDHASCLLALARHHVSLMRLITVQIASVLEEEAAQE